MSCNFERLGAQAVLLQGPGEPWQQRVEEGNVFSHSGENTATVVRDNYGPAVAASVVLVGKRESSGRAACWVRWEAGKQHPMEGSS